MTPYDLELNPDVFLSQPPLKLFRIAKTRYADLSGVGSSFSPGRWNLQGQEAIYTSIDRSTPVLEKLAHDPKKLIPSGLSTMTIHLAGQWQPRISMEGAFLEDRQTGAAFFICESLRKAHELFEGRILSSDGVFAVALPSVIVPVWNVVLYPLGMGFDRHITLESVEPFEFDPRLFPENTPIEQP